MHWTPSMAGPTTGEICESAWTLVGPATLATSGVAEEEVGVEEDTTMTEGEEEAAAARGAGAAAAVVAAAGRGAAAAEAAPASAELIVDETVMEEIVVEEIAVEIVVEIVEVIVVETVEETVEETLLVEQTVDVQVLEAAVVLVKQQQCQDDQDKNKPRIVNWSKLLQQNNSLPSFHFTLSSPGKEYAQILIV